MQCTSIYRKEGDEREMTKQITEAGNVFGSLFEKFMCTSRCRRRVLRKCKNLARYTFPILLQRNSQRIRPSRV